MSYSEDRTAWHEGQGLWQHVPQASWRDWAWRLKKPADGPEHIEQYMTLTEDEKAGCSSANQKLAFPSRPIFSI